MVKIMDLEIRGPWAALAFVIVAALVMYFAASVSGLKDLATPFWQIALVLIGVLVIGIFFKILFGETE